MQRSGEVVFESGSPAGKSATAQALSESQFRQALGDVLRQALGDVPQGEYLRPRKVTIGSTN
jgi:hypothetical protein